MTLGPLLLTPRLVEKPWGGRRLATLGRDLPDGVRVGESWDVADLGASATDVPDPVTRVAHGPHTGRTLAELVSEHRRELLGATVPTEAGRFPLLVKHLDARQCLSVQVHPPESVLDQLPGAALKTESWVVVHAEPGAELLLGVVDGVAPGDVEAAFGTADLLPMVRRRPAHVGDVHHIPAGMIHALGEGVVVAEPQTPSDTTYRLYDWTQEYDRPPRELHREQAMLCLRAAWAVNTDPPMTPPGDGLLIDTAHYRISRTTSPQQTSMEVPSRRTARVVVVVAGELHGAGLPRRLDKGAVVVLPAGWSGGFDVAAGTTWLDIDLT